MVSIGPAYAGILPVAPSFARSSKPRSGSTGGTGRVQDRGLDFPQWSVSLGEIDEAVGRYYRLDPGGLSVHGCRVGPAKAAAVALAARLADMTDRAIGEHYGIGATGGAATHRRQADWPEVLQVVEVLARKLRKRK